VNLGLVHHYLDMPQLAINAFSKSVALAPGSKTAACALYNKGNILYKQGNTGGAIESFSRAIQIDSTQADALFNMGVIYQERKVFDEALYWYEKAAMADPALQQAQAAMECVRGYLRKRKSTLIPSSTKSLSLAQSAPTG